MHFKQATGVLENNEPTHQKKQTILEVVRNLYVPQHALYDLRITAALFAAAE